MRLRILLLCCAALALTVGVATATAGGGNGGNSANAKLCQKGGWQSLYRSDGSSFANQGQCVSYAAKGGALLQTAPISAFLFGGGDVSHVYDFTGTGFTPNHAISFTASGFSSPSSNVEASGTVTTDGSGAFSSSGVSFWGVYLLCSDAPETIHVTATDGVHIGTTDVVFTGC